MICPHPFSPPTIVRSLARLSDGRNELFTGKCGSGGKTEEDPPWFACSSTFATTAFISGMQLQEKGRAIFEEGPEKVSHTGLLLAVYLRYSPECKYHRQESTKKPRQFPVGSVVSTGVNPGGNNAAGNWQPSPLRPQVA